MILQSQPRRQNPLQVESAYSYYQLSKPRRMVLEKDKVEDLESLRSRLSLQGTLVNEKDLEIQFLKSKLASKASGNREELFQEPE